MSDADLSLRIAAVVAAGWVLLVFGLAFLTNLQEPCREEKLLDSDRCSVGARDFKREVSGE